jgi:hypothetical protein
VAHLISHPGPWFWTGAPCSPQRTWAEYGFFQCFHSIHQGSLPLVVVFCSGSKSVGGLRPSFSAHVRWGEHGAPVQGRGPRLRGEELCGIRYRPELIPMRPGAPDSTYARKECVRAAARVLVSAARPLPAPIRFAWRHRSKRPKRLALQLIVALQQTCSPIHAPYLYGTTCRGNLTRVMSDCAVVLNLLNHAAVSFQNGPRRNYESLANSIVRD